MNFEEYKNWLCSMCNPAVHRSEWETYKKHYANHDNMGAEDYTLTVDDENHIIKKRDRLPPDFEREEFELNFNDDVLTQTKNIVNNSFQNIVEPYSRKELQILLEKWIEEIYLSHQATLKYDYYKSFPEFKKALKIIHQELERIKKLIIEAYTDGSPPKQFKREWVMERWDELKKQDLSENKIAKKIREELKETISISTIKRWCKSYNY